MDELKTFRNEIDLIDEQMQTLFLKRMEIVESIANFKMANDLTVYDHNREEEVIQKNLLKIENSEFFEYYEEVLRTILKVSKEYQKRLIIRSTL
ncbi:MAG: chorismate mutase [Firmicutes bacterium]|nr:chorismate mutase [Bacillota bacterium]